MRIVLINHYAGSPEYGMEFRPYYLSYYWNQNGHDVTIVSASYSHLRIKQPELTGPFTEEYINGIRYFWIKTPFYIGNGLRRVINIFTFVLRLWLYRKKIIELKPDVIITSSTYPLDIYPAKKIADSAGSVIVFEPHDLWPTVLYEVGGMRRWHPFVWLMQKAEDKSCQIAKRVVSMHPQNIDHLETRGCIRKNFYHIPNGVDLVAWTEWGSSIESLPELHHKTLDKLKKDNKVILMYTGSVSIANGLDILISTAKLLKQDKIPVHIVIVGDGPVKLKLNEMVTTESINNVTFLPKINKELIPKLLSYAEIAYVGFISSPLYRFGISPNKLWDYMMSGTPILMSINSSNDPVQEAKCGITIKTNDPKDIEHGIKTLVDMSSDKRKQLGINGRMYVVKNNEYKTLAKKFEELLQSCLT